MKFLKDLYRTYIFDPLAGGNGKIQTSEYVQWALVIMIIKSANKEGESVEQVYPDIYWTMIFVVVGAIAGYKHIFQKKDANPESH
jgi:D-alanyl-lipoteichoic acid acyltransferase DltB (MBOAT superfamily)